MSNSADPGGAGSTVGPGPEAPGLTADAEPAEPTRWSVALLDENAIRGEVTAHWIRETVPCTLATSPQELLRVVDQTTTLVCIRDCDDDHDDLVRYLWEVYPHQQVLQLLDRAELAALDRECDETLQEPYGKAELTETVKRLVVQGLYTLKVREYYQLTSYLVSQDRDDDDAATDLTTERLEAQLTQIKGEIGTLTSQFEHADFDGVLQSHRRREEALGTPAMDAEDETRSKYRPSKCPECGLTWGANHGGRLGEGYERVAALVWRCRDCGDVLKVSPGEYDRIL
ncbi:hypothetical protein ACKVMT_01445 [Halobacteriales archaeon Cl-PHB]